ncbi:hypothetical protein KQX54_011513 [Cotesia glomerata]|uniref:Uncharacterized protein n=1 Tax=Cotesia glomerata TaxID=32391 RepID=A0AAV7IEU7_COTGL|nr:hypothetical protein KQX54_011513 [Cotesia glomerata]
MSGPHSSTLAPVFSLPPPLGPGVFPSPPVVQGDSLGLCINGVKKVHVSKWEFSAESEDDMSYFEHRIEIPRVCVPENFTEEKNSWEIKYHPPSLRSLACVTILSNTEKLSTCIDLGYLGSIMAFSSTTKVLAMSRKFDPSFVTVRTLYEHGYTEYGMEEAVRALETSKPELFEPFDKRLTNTTNEFIHDIRRNFSAELNIDDGDIRAEYTHQGQSGLADFIDQGVEQKFFNIEEKGQEEEGDSQADFFDEEDSSPLPLHKTESASAHEEECFQSTYDEEEEVDLSSLINLEYFTPSQNWLITDALRKCEEEKILPIHLPEAEIPIITINEDIPLITLTGEEDKNLIIKEKSALSQEVDNALKEYFVEQNLKKRKNITILDDNIVNNKFVMFEKKPKIQ